MLVDEFVYVHILQYLCFCPGKVTYTPQHAGKLVCVGSWGSWTVSLSEAIFAELFCELFSSFGRWRNEAGCLEKVHYPQRSSLYWQSRLDA